MLRFSHWVVAVGQRPSAGISDTLICSPRPSIILAVTCLTKSGASSETIGGISWPVAYVALLGLYVLMHYMFVSQSAQVLALLGVFLDVGLQTGVPLPLMGFALLFASSYFSTLTPQGGSQNIIFAASGYLTQRELYRLGLITTVFCTAVFLVIGTPWILWVG